MAAFCGCCGAEISAKAEACVVCGTPRHGMMKPAPRSDEVFTTPAPNWPTLSEPPCCTRR